MRIIKRTSQFKKDYKRAIKRGLPKEELRVVIEMLASDQPLPGRYRAHMLTGQWSGHWECHIRPDWLLIYKVLDEQLILSLVRTGTHSDLFEE